MSAAVNVQEFIDSRRLGAFQLRVVALCAFIVLIDGFDTQAIGFVAPAIVESWHIRRADLGPVFAASLTGLMIGALVFSASAAAQTAAVLFAYYPDAEDDQFQAEILTVLTDLAVRDEASAQVLAGAVKDPNALRRRAVALPPSTGPRRCGCSWSRCFHRPTTGGRTAIVSTSWKSLPRCVPLFCAFRAATIWKATASRRVSTGRR